MNAKSINIDGREFTNTKAALRFYDISHTTYSKRLKNGWTQEDAIKTPIQRKHLRKQIKVEGKIFQSISDALKKYKTSEGAYRNRLQQGMSQEEAIITPLIKKTTKKLTLEDIQKAARDKGIECLSKEYKNSRTKMKFKCKEGHVWWAPGRKRIYGCLKCSNTTLKEAQNYAINKGGKCLSKTYKTTKDPLLWECALGHKWEASFSSIKYNKSWCPICSSGISEKICRSIFEKMFGVEFPKRKPSWLTNKCGNRLELDGFNEGLKIAFEHQGSQHFIKISYFNKKSSLEKIQHHDRIKLKVCKKRGIVLIVVPEILGYFSNLNQAKKYIIDQLELNKVFIPNKEIELNINDLYLKHSKKTMRFIKKKKNGKAIKIEGINYESITKACEAYGVSKSNLRYRMNKHSLSLEEAFVYKSKFWWTKEENSILIKNYNKSTNQLKSLLPERSINSINNRIQRLKRECLIPKIHRKAGA
jgi:hypothetical protein